MGWTHLVHDCELPTRAEGRLVRADVGSVWECPLEGCARSWSIVGYTVDDGFDWHRYWPWYA